MLYKGQPFYPILHFLKAQDGAERFFQLNALSAIFLCWRDALKKEPQAPPYRAIRVALYIEDIQEEMNNGSHP